MITFDVVIVGGGPSGGQCARVLSKKGWKVLLVEQQPDFDHNNFSSAGSVLSILKTYNLPLSVVGSYWKNLRVVTTKKNFLWSSDENQGVVLDFAKLRNFLAKDAQEHRATVWLYHKYVSHEKTGNMLQVTLLNRHSREHQVVNTRLLVDATGAQHSVINQMATPGVPYKTAVGLEYLIRTDQKECHPHDTLSFLLGDHWMPEGYAWVFPMTPSVYKVGVGVYVNSDIKEMPTLTPYVQKLINEYMHLKNYELLDKHGGVLRYCTPEHEHGYNNQVIAIGDAFSCVNMLGGEGIRHGMHSANLAAHYIDKTLRTGKSHFHSYRKAILKRFNKTWKKCETYSDMAYQVGAEDKIDIVFGYLQKLPLSAIVDVLFHYRFNKLKWLLVKRLVLKIIRFGIPKKSK